MSKGEEKVRNTEINWIEKIKITEYDRLTRLGSHIR